MYNNVAANRCVSSKGTRFGFMSCKALIRCVMKIDVLMPGNDFEA